MNTRDTAQIANKVRADLTKEKLLKQIKEILCDEEININQNKILRSKLDGTKQRQR